MPNQNLTVYLSRELAERVDAAKAEGLLDPKVVVKAALEQALKGEPTESQDTEPGWVRYQVGKAYELVWAENEQHLQARLDAVTDAGGWPVSVAFNPQGRICLLVGWNLEDKPTDE